LHLRGLALCDKQNHKQKAIDQIKQKNAIQLQKSRPRRSEAREYSIKDDKYDT
jgi:hypothetical protein